VLIEKVIEAKQAKIRQRPCHTNRASSLGHPCERRLVLDRTRWQEALLYDVGLQFIFDEGQQQERQVLLDLIDAGWTIIEQQRDYEWKAYQITAHLDGKVVLPDLASALPLEVKSMSPYIFKQIQTAEDLLHSRFYHVRAYPAQMQIYLLLSNSERGVFIFKDKSSGQLKEIWMELDYDYAEGLLKKAERINAHVAAGTLPERIPYDEKVCGRCPFLHICLPEVKREALDLTTDPELETKLIRRAALDAPRKEFDVLDKDIKAQFLRCDSAKVVVGDFLLVKKEQARQGKPITVVSIDRLQPVKGASDE